MSAKDGVDRRQFLLTGAALAGTAALPARDKLLHAEAPRTFQSRTGSSIPYSREELVTFAGPQRTFTGRSLSEVAFPLGGIGTGTVSLGGRGELRDWEIFNRPGKGKVLPFSFVAVRVLPEGGSPAVKAVESVELSPFRGSFGSSRESAQGLSRFTNARFTGEYPFAKVDFEDDAFPVSITLEAFNPFVPHDVDDSSLPAAIFHYDVRCTGKELVDVSLAFSLLNAVGYDGTGAVSGEQYPGFGKNLTSLRQEEIGPSKTVIGLDMTSQKYDADHPRHGSMTLLTDSPEATARTSWENGAWWDSFQKWLDEFTTTGALRDTKPPEPSADGRSNYATLVRRLRLAPGQKKRVTFVLAWHFPVRENYWNEEPEVKGQKLRNYYGTRFKNAWDVGKHVWRRMEELETRTRRFHGALFQSTLPPYVLDAVSSQMSILRTNTCMLLEGKQFFAFEGCGDDSGCCPMNCTHVWNYEQALAFLFPELERSMRITDFKHNLRPDGAMAFRSLLPLDRALWNFKPAADGQMGSVLKLYREWQLSGDDRFLADLWPQAKRALEYAWVQWDADRDGVMEGEQHNTYDIEFYGPNTMMGSLYLGALRAGERMAAAMGDSDAAVRYRAIREQGEKELEDLWNGEYYTQKVPKPEDIRAVRETVNPNWHADAVRNAEIRYQYGDGCLSDQLLGQWFCHVVGLGYVLSQERVRQTMQSIFRHNFKQNFFTHSNTQRIYALNDDKGLLLCSWPKGGRPALPFVYSDEVWTGIEYQVAAHLIYEGLLEEGLAIVKGVRERYDGEKRNPWNEVECGSHYARALASWSLLLALSGYTYSGPEHILSFAPRVSRAKFQSFFSTGSGWGVFQQKSRPESVTATLAVKQGEVSVRKLHLNAKGELSQRLACAVTTPDGKQLPCSIERHGSSFNIDFGRIVVIAAETSLKVEVKG